MADDRPTAPRDAGKRPGRPRRYDAPTPEGFANPEAARFAAALDELSERLFDLIRDLPEEVLRARPEGAANSIQDLAVHMAAAEANWLIERAGAVAPADLKGRLLLFPDPGGPVARFDSKALEAFCRRERDEIALPALRLVASLDAVEPARKRIPTLRGVLLHLLWHWTYHTGQVGLLRRLARRGYRWTFAG